MSFNPTTNTVYAAFVSYLVDYGLEAMPVAGPVGSECEIVATHAPVAVKLVQWCVQAYDESPKPPDPCTGTDNEVSKLKAIGAPFKSEMADGTVVTTIAGTYVYLLKIPPSDTDSLVIGTPPFDRSLWNVILPTDFIKGLLSGSGNTPSGSGAYGGQQ